MVSMLRSDWLRPNRACLTTGVAKVSINYCASVLSVMVPNRTLEGKWQQLRVKKDEIFVPVDRRRDNFLWHLKHGIVKGCQGI